MRLHWHVDVKKTLLLLLLEQQQQHNVLVPAPLITWTRKIYLSQSFLVRQIQHKIRGPPFLCLLASRAPTKQHFHLLLEMDHSEHQPACLCILPILVYSSIMVALSFHSFPLKTAMRVSMSGFAGVLHIVENSNSAIAVSRSILMTYDPKYLWFIWRWCWEVYTRCSMPDVSVLVY